MLEQLSQVLQDLHFLIKTTELSVNYTVDTRHVQAKHLIGTEDSLFHGTLEVQKIQDLKITSTQKTQVL